MSEPNLATTRDLGDNVEDAIRYQRMILGDWPRQSSPRHPFGRYGDFVGQLPLDWYTPEFWMPGRSWKPVFGDPSRRAYWDLPSRLSAHDAILRMCAQELGLVGMTSTFYHSKRYAQTLAQIDRIEDLWSWCDRTRRLWASAYEGQSHQYRFNRWLSDAIRSDGRCWEPTVEGERDFLRYESPNYAIPHGNMPLHRPLKVRSQYAFHQPSIDDAVERASEALDCYATNQQHTYRHVNVPGGAAGLVWLILHECQFVRNVAKFRPDPLAFVDRLVSYAVPAWPDSFRTGNVMGVGRRLLGLREAERMQAAAVWADTLEEAGCESAFWLQQLRDPEFCLLDQHGPAVWLKSKQR